LQETQAPLHETLQQTPSAQNPDAHSAPFLHVAPLSFSPQLPATHFVPAQSESDAQVAKQAFVAGLHWKGAQTVAGPALHRPLPSQTLPPATDAPSQAPAWHTAPTAYLRQAPAPSQVPSSPQVETSLFGHSLADRGEAPEATSVHVPGEPGALQVLHVSPQATLQQTPSAQKPLAQSAAHAHDWPFGLRAAPAPLQGTSTARVSAPLSGTSAMVFEPQPAASAATQRATASLSIRRRARSATI
jgi:hypothetical protein